MKREKTVDICPVCGGSDLYYEAGGYTDKIYRCKSWDYVGALIVEADEEMVEAIREEYEMKNEVKNRID